MIARYLARRAMRHAIARATAYRGTPYRLWCVHTQIVLDRRARDAQLNWARL